MDYAIVTTVASAVSAAGVLYTLVGKRRKARLDELHESMVLWVKNGGGKAIREIVHSENLAVLQRFDLHEATEPLRFQQFIEEALKKR